MKSGKKKGKNSSAKKLKVTKLRGSKAGKKTEERRGSDGQYGLSLASKIIERHPDLGMVCYGD